MAGLFSQPILGNGGIFGGGDPGTPGGDQRQAMMAQLLAGGGYSTQRQSFGQIMGQALMAGQAARQQSIKMQQARDAAELEKKYKQAQIDKLNARGDQFGNIDVDQFTPASLATFQKSGDYGVLQRRADANVGKYNPGEFTPESWNLFAKGGYSDPSVLKRWVTPANPVVTDVAGVRTVVQPTKPGVSVGPSTPTQTPLTTLDAETDAQRRIADAKGAGAKTGELTAGAQYDLPRVERTVKQAVDDIDKLKNHPGLSAITGWGSLMPIVPGTDQAAADARAKQIEGQTFLQAYQSLKGSGAITEVEGAKGEQAIARLKRAQTEDDYKAALDDLKTVIQSGLEQARQQASGSSSAPKSGAKRRYNPATGRIE